MINGIFYFMMNAIGNILKFIIIFGIIGFILLLPFLLKGGWILGVLIYGFFVLAFVVAADNIDENNKSLEEDKRKDK